MAPFLKSVNNGQKFFVMNFIIDFYNIEFARAIYNRMESSIFAILREYYIHCKV
jgi:hypothetical protein